MWNFFCLHSLSQTLNPSNFNVPDKELPLSDVQLPLVILWDEAFLLLPGTELPS